MVTIVVMINRSREGKVQSNERSRESVARSVAASHPPAFTQSKEKQQQLVKVNNTREEDDQPPTHDVERCFSSSCDGRSKSGRGGNAAVFSSHKDLPAVRPSKTEQR
jgi:hypothetical protein